MSYCSVIVVVTPKSICSPCCRLCTRRSGFFCRDVERRRGQWLSRRGFALAWLELLCLFRSTPVLSQSFFPSPDHPLHCIDRLSRCLPLFRVVVPWLVCGVGWGGVGPLLHSSIQGSLPRYACMTKLPPPPPVLPCLRSWPLAPASPVVARTRCGFFCAARYSRWRALCALSCCATFTTLSRTRCVWVCTCVGVSSLSFFVSSRCDGVSSTVYLVSVPSAFDLRKTRRRDKRRMSTITHLADGTTVGARH